MLSDFIRKPVLLDAYLKMLVRTAKQMNDNFDNRGLVREFVFCGVRAANLVEKPEESKAIIDYFGFLQGIKDGMSHLTPNEFETVFPIEKRYDGHKWQEKDFYYTQQELEKIGDQPIGDNIAGLLFDYQNEDVRLFTVNVWSTLESLQHLHGKESITDQWLRENNIPTYTLCKDRETGEECTINNDTGERTDIDLHPYLKLVK